LSQTTQRKISEDSNTITLVLRTDGLYVQRLLNCYSEEVSFCGNAKFEFLTAMMLRIQVFRDVIFVD